jgi:hypothetical protein
MDDKADNVRKQKVTAKMRLLIRMLIGGFGYRLRERQGFQVAKIAIIPV